jgi:hypothetical protein
MELFGTIAYYSITMPDYQKGKIYNVIAPDNTKYIGSTVQELKSRYIRHKSRYKKYKAGDYHFLTIFDLFDKHSVNDCKIELIEHYPCNSKKELEIREGYYIRNNVCVNKRIEGRSELEWRSTNSERLNKYWKDRHNRDGDNKRRQMRDYYNKNIEKQKQRLRDNHYKRKAIKELLGINLDVLKY